MNLILPDIIYVSKESQTVTQGTEARLLSNTYISLQQV